MASLIMPCSVTRHQFFFLVDVGLHRLISRAPCRFQSRFRILAFPPPPPFCVLSPTVSINKCVCSGSPVLVLGCFDLQCYCRRCFRFGVEFQWSFRCALSSSIERLPPIFFFVCVLLQRLYSFSEGVTKGRCTSRSFRGCIAFQSNLLLFWVQPLCLNKVQGTYQASRASKIQAVSAQQQPFKCSTPGFIWACRAFKAFSAALRCVALSLKFMR